MIAVVTILAAFPLGFFLRNRLAANTVFAVAYLWAFTFQTLYLLLDSLGGAEQPAFDVGEFPAAYGAMTLAVLLVGLGLVNLGHWVRARRQTSSRSSRTGTSESAASGKTAASANVAG